MHCNCVSSVHERDLAHFIKSGSSTPQKKLQRTVPCLGVPADAHKWQGSHGNCVDPAYCHDLARRAEFETFVEVYGVCNGVPALARNHCQCEDGQLASEDGEETCHLASGTYSNVKFSSLTKGSCVLFICNFSETCHLRLFRSN